MKKLFRNIIFFLSIVILFNSCGGTDDEEIDSVPMEPISTQYVIENDSIIEYMQTHFYNYEDFTNLSSNNTIELIIDTISGDNSDKISLFDQVTTLSIDILDENDEVVPHNLYYIINREGSGQSPTVADSVFVSYNP